MNAHARTWELASSDDATLVVGRQDTIHLRADNVSCIDSIMLKDPAGKELKADWKSVKANEVEIKLPLQEAQPGALTLLVSQFGVADPQPVALRLFAEAGRFDGFSMHAGESQGTLKGSRLDEVTSLTVKNVTFVPGDPSTRGALDELPMIAQDAATASALRPDRNLAGKVTLQDGRSLPVNAAVEAPRPRVTLIGKSVQPDAAAADNNIQLTDAAELPQDATLKFSLRTLSPTAFARDVIIEVATGDESASAALSIANGGLTLENSQVAVATLVPGKAFGVSTFGQLKFRVVVKGAAGDWQALATLVRLPVLQELKCPQSAELACKLVGVNLFLIHSVSDDAQFSHPIVVPEGFLGSALPVPHPTGPLYVKLRDNPDTINTTTLSAQPLPAAAQARDWSEARRSAPSDPTAPPPAASTP
jgi:hypothetical protein